MPLTVRGRTIPIRYAVAAVVLVVALVVAGVMTAPRSVGVEGSWEAPDPGGEVLGGRALVTDGSNKALDLVSGTTITIGSVSGGDRRVAGGRLLILGADRLDAAALDATQRWTWKAPGEGTLTLLASTRTATVVRFCPTGSTAGAPCTLRGIGPTGGSIWTLTEPSSTAGQDAVVARLGGVAAVAVLPAGAHTWALVDPATGRLVVRAAERVFAEPDGTVWLLQPEGTGCTVSRGTSIDALKAEVTGQPCPPASNDPVLPIPDTGRSFVWWHPWSRAHVTYLTPSTTGPRLVTRDPVTLLATDAEGITVREGDKVVRYKRTTNP